MTQSGSLTDSPVAGLQTSAFAPLADTGTVTALSRFRTVRLLSDQTHQQPFRFRPICGHKEFSWKLFKAVVRLEGNDPLLQTESAFPIVALASAFASAATFS